MLMLPKRAWRTVDRRTRMMWTAAGADTFLASFPKSGRTWFRYILSQYLSRRADGDADIDLHRMFEIVPNYDVDPVRGIPAFRYGDRRGDVPLILVTHHLYKDSLFLRRPVVFMVRDPRDTIVSAYFHATRHKRRFAGDLEEFIPDEEHGLPALTRYLNAWAEGLRRHNHVVLSYEELSRDTAGATSRVLEFLGQPIVDSILADAVAAAGFEAMREREMEAGLPSHEYDRSDAESLRMRRGKVGGFSDYLTDRQAGMLTDLCERRLLPSAKRLIECTGMKLA